MKTIIKISRGVFNVYTGHERRARRIPLDFNPVIAMLTDREKSFDYKLIHWQSSPRGEREWGIYDPIEDTYKSGVFPNHQTGYGAMKMKMLDDSTSSTLPSSVIYFAGYLPVDNDPNISVSVED